MTIYKTNDCYKIATQGESMAFFSGDIEESKRLLEYLVFTLGLNTDGEKIEISVKPR